MILAAVGAYAGLAAARWQGACAGLSVASIVVLAAAVAKRRAAVIPPAIALAASAYGVAVASRDPELDRAAVVVAALLLVAAELGFWSVELAAPVRYEARILTRRAALVAALGLGALATSGVIALAASQEADRSLVLQGLGVAAAVAIVGLIVGLVAAARS